MNELRSNMGTESRAELEKRLDQKLIEHLTGVKTRSRKAQIALRGAKAAALRGSWAKTLQRQCEQCEEIAYADIPVLEWRFHPERKWRFDCAFIIKRITVEIEGGIWTRGRHTRGNGYLNDMQKYNEATRLGWRIFRFTPNQVKTGVALEYLKVVLDKATG